MMKYRNILSTSAMLCLTLAALTGCASGSSSTDVNQTSTSNSVAGGESNQVASTTPANTSGNDVGSSSSDNTASNNTLPSQSLSSSGVGSVTTSQAGASSAPGMSSKFPYIVNLAMGHLSSSVKEGAEAPTLFPEASDGSVNLYFHTYQSTTRQMGFLGMETMYRVQFSSAHDPLASYLGARYDTTANATNGFMSQIGDVTAQGNQSAVELAYNHQGTLAVNSDNQQASIVWSEGRWGIRVTQEHSNQGNTAVANQVVSYLQTHFMPVPHDKAAILVDVDGSSTTVTVAWQVNNELYEIDVQPHCKNPVQTGLAMAISMHPYP